MGSIKRFILSIEIVLFNENPNKTLMNKIVRYLTKELNNFLKFHFKEMGGDGGEGNRS